MDGEIMENFIKLDDLGVPLFSETCIYFWGGYLRGGVGFSDQLMTLWSGSEDKAGVVQWFWGP